MSKLYEVECDLIHIGHVQVRARTPHEAEFKVQRMIDDGSFDADAAGFNPHKVEVIEDHAREMAPCEATNPRQPRSQTRHAKAPLPSPQFEFMLHMISNALCIKGLTLDDETQLRELGLSWATEELITERPITWPQLHGIMMEVFKMLLQRFGDAEEKATEGTP
jgi:hypothetical protein